MATPKKQTNQPTEQNATTAPETATSETATAPTATAPTAPELTSAKMEELKAKQIEFMKAQSQAMQEGNMDAAREAMFNAFQIESQIAAEKQSIKLAISAAEIAEAKAKQIQLLQNVVDAAILQANFEASANHEAPEYIEQSNKLNDAYKTAFDVVANQLNSKFVGASKPSASKTASANGTHNGNTAEILSKHLANVASGMDDSASRKDLEASGYARSTVWHTVNNYNKAKV